MKGNLHGQVALVTGASAAKAGLRQLTRCMYTELRPYGARATCIIPSWGAADFAGAAEKR